MSNRTKIKFAIIPTKLDNGKWIWFQKYSTKQELTVGYHGLEWEILSKFQS